MSRQRRGQPGLLRAAPRFRYLWLSRTISATGAGLGRTALVLLTARSGPGMVSLTLAAVALPQLAGPLAGAIADRVDQRRLLVGCEAGQGAIYAVIALARPPAAALVPLAVAAALLAVLMSPAGKGSVPRLVPAGRLPRANALLGLALNLQVVAGPAIGGLLAGLASPAAAFAVNACAFFLSALLLTRLGPLPPASPPRAGGLLAETGAGLAYAARSAVLRALVLGTGLFVSFAAIDNVALVFLAERALHGTGSSYGMTAAAYGAGMVLASLVLVARAGRRPAEHWLIGGVMLGAAGAAVTGIAPSFAVAAAGQVIGGAGNSADLVGTDTLIQRLVPPPMLGRAFAAVYTAAQLASAVASGLAGPLVALAGPRTAFLVAGAGTLTGLAVLLPAVRGRRSPQVVSG